MKNTDEEIKLVEDTLKIVQLRQEAGISLADQLNDIMFRMDLRIAPDTPEQQAEQIADNFVVFKQEMAYRRQVINGN